MVGTRRDGLAWGCDLQGEMEDHHVLRPGKLGSSCALGLTFTGDEGFLAGLPDLLDSDLVQSS